MFRLVFMMLCSMVLMAPASAASGDFKSWIGGQWVQESTKAQSQNDKFVELLNRGKPISKDELDAINANAQQRQIASMMAMPLPTGKRDAIIKEMLGAQQILNLRFRLTVSDKSVLLDMATTEDLTDVGKDDRKKITDLMAEYSVVGVSGDSLRLAMGDKDGAELVLRKVDDKRIKAVMVTAGTEFEFGKMLMNTSSVFEKVK